LHIGGELQLKLATNSLRLCSILINLSRESSGEIIFRANPRSLIQVLVGSMISSQLIRACSKSSAGKYNSLIGGCSNATRAIVELCFLSHKQSYLEEEASKTSYFLLLMKPYKSTSSWNPQCLYKGAHAYLNIYVRRKVVNDYKTYVPVFNFRFPTQQNA